MINRWLAVYLLAVVVTYAGESDGSTNSSFLSKPLELRLGPLNFHPRLSFGSTYNDNILYSSTNPKRDFISSVHPAFLTVVGDQMAVAEARDNRLNYFEYREYGAEVYGITPAMLMLYEPANWPGPLAMLDYGPQINWFNKYHENNSIDQLLNFNALWPMSSLALGVSQGYNLENTGSVEAGQRLKLETISSAFTSGYRFNELTSIEFNLRRLNIAYPDSSTLLGYTKYGNDSWFNYQVASSVSASAGIDWGLIEVSGGQNQTYERYQLRARYLFAESLSFYASTGFETRQFQNGHPGTQNPVFLLAANYQPFEATTFYLNGYREENSSAYSGYNYSQTGLSIGGRQQFSDRFTLSASLGYYRLEYVPLINQALPDLKNDYLQAQLNFAFRITSQIEAKLFYQYQNLSSPQAQGFSNNQVGFRVNWAF